MIPDTVPAKTIYCRAPTASPRAQHRSASPAMARPKSDSQQRLNSNRVLVRDEDLEAGGFKD